MPGLGALGREEEHSTDLGKATLEAAETGTTEEKGMLTGRHPHTPSGPLRTYRFSVCVLTLQQKRK